MEENKIEKFIMESRIGFGSYYYCRNLCPSFHNAKLVASKEDKPRPGSTGWYALGP